MGISTQLNQCWLWYSSCLGYCFMCCICYPVLLDYEENKGQQTKDSKSQGGTWQHWKENQGCLSEDEEPWIYQEQRNQRSLETP